MATLTDAVRDFKRQWLTDQLRAHGGCRSSTARAIGTNRTYVERLIAELGIDVPRTAPRRSTRGGVCHCSRCGEAGHNARRHGG